MDLGLPSGTLWLDRLVGAKSPTSPGLYYQWGALEGHALSDGFNFNNESYAASGLNSITASLTDEQDAARAYYGNAARMPSRAQLEELLQYCSGSTVSQRDTKLTSSINGNSITLHLGGFIDGTSLALNNEIRAWTRSIYDAGYASSLHGFRSFSVQKNLRKNGLNVLAVHA